MEITLTVAFIALAATLIGVLVALFVLGFLIVTQNNRLEAKIDAQGAHLEAKIDAQSGRVTAAELEQARINGVNSVIVRQIHSHNPLDGDE